MFLESVNNGARKGIPKVNNYGINRRALIVALANPIGSFLVDVKKSIFFDVAPRRLHRDKSSRASTEGRQWVIETWPNGGQQRSGLPPWLAWGRRIIRVQDLEMIQTRL